MKKVSIFLYLFLFLVITSCSNSDSVIESHDGVIDDDNNESLISDISIKAISKVSDFFSNSETIDDLVAHLDKIRQTDGIANVSSDNIALYITTTDGLNVSYLFPPEPDIDDDTEEDGTATFARVDKNTRVYDYLPRHGKVCILNQLSRDEKWKKRTVSETQNLANEFETCDFEVNLQESLSLSFLTDKEEFPGYDIYFFITHGGYNKTFKHHTMVTSDELFTYDVNKTLTATDYNSIRQKAEEVLNGFNIKCTKEEIGLSYIKETRSKNNVAVVYLNFNEDFVKNHFPRLDGAIVFVNSCKSLAENYYMIESFEKIGAGFYLGYDDSNSVGDKAGVRFFENLLNGQSVGSAYQNLPSKYKWNKGASAHGSFNATLYAAYCNNYTDGKIIRPTTLDCIDKSEGLTLNYVLSGSVKLLNPLTANLIYGFCISNTIEELGKNEQEGIKITDLRCKLDKNNFTFEQSLDAETVIGEEKLDFDKTYYYCSYIFDGNDYIYGDTLVFSTKSATLCPDDNHPHTIDLGLPSGTKWRCCNLGTNSPLDFGDYYSWAEIQVKPTYFNDDYSFYDATNTLYSIPQKVISGDPHYDVATATLGSPWQLPTKEQCDELMEYCTAKNQIVDGKRVMLLTSKKNGKGIMFRPGGSGSGLKLYPNLTSKGEEYTYWSGTLLTEDYPEDYDYYLRIYDIDKVPRAYTLHGTVYREDFSSSWSWPCFVGYLIRSVRQ